jgi:hypothetical protein
MLTTGISSTCIFSSHIQYLDKSGTGVNSNSSYSTFDRTQTQSCSASSVKQLSSKRLEMCSELIRHKKFARRSFIVLFSELFASTLRATENVRAEEDFENIAAEKSLFQHFDDDDEESQKLNSKNSGNLKRVRYKGSSWSITLPENFERKQQQKKCTTNCKSPTGSQQNSEVIQFSDNHAAEIAIYVREANSFKLSLLQLSDIREFGNPKSAATILLPVGYKLNHYSERIENYTNDERVYYTWDITFSDQRILVTV